MGPGQAWSMLRWSLEQRGVAGTVRTAMEKVKRSRTADAKDDAVSYFDREYGVDTDGMISGGRLATGSRNDVHNASYLGCAPSRLRGGVELWNNKLAGGGYESYTFIDLGSGKGRAVLVATEYSFRKVIGVELNPGLTAIAKANMQIWSSLGRAKSSAELICQDVTEFVFPEGPCVIYMYNPFAAPVMEEVIRSIEGQFANRPSEVDVLYFKPEHGELFEAHSGFSLLWSGVVPLSPEDEACDRVNSAAEICCMYRWTGV